MRTCFSALAACLLSATIAHAGEFPDAYYFSGDKRPAKLRALEGKPASELKVDTWIGDATTIADNRGDVIIIDFWATWCGPCVASIPKNIKLVNTYGDKGLTFIGIHDANNGWDKAEAMIKSKGVNYPVAKDDGGQTTKAYKLQFWPTYIAIDRTGTIRAAGLRPGNVEDVVKLLLAEAGGGQTTADAPGEFPAEWFIGATARTPSMRTLEGKKAPPLPIADVQSWIGTKPSPDAMRGHVTVLRFLSPTDRGTPRHLATWRKQAHTLSKQGVVFLGVCDPLAKWADMQQLAGDTKETALPIALDLQPKKDALPMGTIAASYGIRMWPTSIIIDRNGTIRAAGLHDKHIDAVVTKLLAEPATTDTKPAAS
jgi:thiol-disulfide isomerase/thioredoxin